jgi:hypothetical protein
MEMTAETSGHKLERSDMAGLIRLRCQFCGWYVAICRAPADAETEKLVKFFAGAHEDWARQTANAQVEAVIDNRSHVEQLREHFIAQHASGYAGAGESPLTGDAVNVNDWEDLKAAHDFDHDPEQWKDEPSKHAPYITEHSHEEVK